MYKLKEEKLTLEQTRQGCADLKKDLYDSISYENQRTNVDTAKKRAVAQLMDYGQFRQMVLGANIKPMKTTEVSQMLNYQNSKGVMNREAALSSLQNNDTGDGEENEPAQVKRLTKEEGYEKPATFREFRKVFERCLEERTDEEEKSDAIVIQRRAFNYMRSIPIDKYNKVLTVELDAQYLMKIIMVFSYIIEQELCNEEDLQFIFEILERTTKINSFSFNVLTFLSKKEKQQLSEFFQKMKQALEKAASEPNKQQMEAQLDKVAKLYVK